MDKMKRLTRRTKQRELILKTLRSTDSHPTADWIYAEVRKEMPHISLGTVYRNLGILKEAGEVMELGFGSKPCRYDGNPENHYHFVCLQCGKVLDLHNMPVDDGVDAMVSQQEGMKVLYHRTKFFGLCQECAERENSRN